MFDETHVLELLPAYALESLEEAEMRLVAEHLAGCHLCRTELRAFEEVAAELASMAPQASPSPRLRSQLQERIRGLNSTRAQPGRPQPERRPRFGWLMPAGAIAGLVLIIALLASNILLWQRLAHLEVLTGPMGMRSIALQNTDVVAQASAFAIISADGQNGVLVVDELPVLDAAHEYQLWLVRGEENTSAAVFSVDESGYRGLRIQAPESLLNYSAVRVTVEPAGGSIRPTGEEVFHGSLFNP